jgi:hypothetical protein
VRILKIAFLICLFWSSFVIADQSQSTKSDQESMGVISDLLIVRPIAVAGTIAGAAIFLGISPFTGLASIAPPHDAFSKAGSALVGLPACYAFHRPLGGPFNGQDAEGQRPCTW